MVTASAETLAGFALDSVAVAVSTTAAVIWPVETAADVIIRAAYGEGAAPWVPAGQEWRERHWPPLGRIAPARHQLHAPAGRRSKPRTPSLTDSARC